MKSKAEQDAKETEEKGTTTILHQTRTKHPTKQARHHPQHN